MPTIYNRNDPGAPALTFNISTTSTVHFTNLKNILKACLVNGYANRPAAGWTLELDAASAIIFRNVSKTAYFCFAISYRNGTINNAFMTCSLSYTFTGVSNGIIQGVGARSGNTSATQQVINQGGTYSASARCSWVVYADANTCVLQQYTTASGASPDQIALRTGSNAWSSLIYFGNDSKGWPIVVGGENSVITSATATSNNFRNSGFTALRAPDTGELYDTGNAAIYMQSLYAPSMTDANSAQVHVPIDELFFSPIRWNNTQASGGYLRGVVLESEISGTMPGYAAPVAFGLTGYDVTNACNPIELPDGTRINLGLALGGSNRYPILIDSAEFW